MRKILLFIFTITLLSFPLSSEANADIFQDVYFSLLGGGRNAQFPNASLDGGGYLPATADFCPVCPIDQPNSVYQKFGFGEQPGNLGCHTPEGDRIDSGGTALDCASTTYKFCGNQGQDTGGKTTGCCKNADLTNCTRNPSNPDEPPPPDTEKCLRCPDGTFQENRGEGLRCYYPRNNPDHGPAESVPYSSDDSVCIAPLICDRSYFTGCKTQAELDNLRDNPPGDVKPTPNTPLSQPCTDTDEKWGCLKINTALGEVDTQAPEFVRWVLSFVLGVSGAIVLIIIIITGYRLMTSQGDPEKVKNAREALTAAIVGLLFIIFSLVILQFITVNVLQLPGFGG